MNYADLNEFETKILNEILNAIKEKGYSPTVREIRSATNIKSTSTVQKYWQPVHGRRRRHVGRQPDEGVHLRADIAGRAARYRAVPSKIGRASCRERV